MQRRESGVVQAKLHTHDYKLECLEFLGIRCILFSLKMKLSFARDFDHMSL